MSSHPRQTARQNRLYGYKHPLDDTKIEQMQIVRHADGEVRPGITISGQVVTLDFSKDNSLYPDDVIAWITAMYEAFGPGRPRNERIKHLLKEATYEADRGSVERHNYSESEEERNIPVPYQ